MVTTPTFPCWHLAAQVAASVADRLTPTQCSVHTTQPWWTLFIRMMLDRPIVLEKKKTWCTGSQLDICTNWLQVPRGHEQRQGKQAFAGARQHWWVSSTIWKLKKPTNYEVGNMWLFLYKTRTTPTELRTKIILNFPFHEGIIPTDRSSMMISPNI